MKILVTGSSGHLGEALVRTLRAGTHTVIGMDILPSPFTDLVGSIVNREMVLTSMSGIDAVFHTATLHKPHVGTHSRQQFVDTNISGTLNLLEAAVANSVQAFIFTSTTSTFGDALSPNRTAPASWITEAVRPLPKNIYGATKTAAEDLCQLFHRNQGLACIVLRTARFFPESDDDPQQRDAYDDANLKVNEYLNRRVDVEDVVSAHFKALEQAQSIGFDRFIISATSPFRLEDLAELRIDVSRVLRKRAPGYEQVYDALGWKVPADIDRVYVNQHARTRLGWEPHNSFERILDRLRRGKDPGSELARSIGSKGYHTGIFSKGPYPTASS